MIPLGLAWLAMGLYVLGLVIGEVDDDSAWFFILAALASTVAWPFVWGLLIGCRRAMGRNVEVPK